MKLWRKRIQQNYSSLEELQHYDSIYGIAKRLGYRSCKKLWQDNPLVQGSVNPADFSLVK